MKEIYIGITKGSNTALYDAASSSEYLGRQWENNATALVFERPKEEEHSAMFLVFDTEYGERIGSVALGSGNTYIVPSEVTERSKVVMGITFVQGAHVINTQPLRFKLTEAPKPVDYEQQGMTDVLDTVLDVITHCVYSVSTTRNAQGLLTLTFYNKAGEVTAVERVQDTGISNVEINGEGRLIMTFTDGTVADLGSVKTPEIIDSEVDEDGILWLIKDNGERMNCGYVKGQDGNAAVAANLTWCGKWVYDKRVPVGGIVQHYTNLWVCSSGEYLVEPPIYANEDSSAWTLFLEGAVVMRDMTELINATVTDFNVPYSCDSAFFHAGTIFKKDGSVYMLKQPLLTRYSESRTTPNEKVFLFPGTVASLWDGNSYSTVSGAEFWETLLSYDELKGDTGVGINVKNPKIYDSLDKLRQDTGAATGAFGFIPSSKTVYIKTDTEWEVFGYTNNMLAIGSEGGGTGGSIVVFEDSVGRDINDYKKTTSQGTIYAFDLPEEYEPQVGDLIKMTVKVPQSADTSGEGMLELYHEYVLKIKVDLVEVGNHRGSVYRYGSGQQLVDNDVTAWTATVDGNASSGSFDTKYKVQLTVPYTQPLLLLGGSAIITKNPKAFFDRMNENESIIEGTADYEIYKAMLNDFKDGFAISCLSGYETDAGGTPFVTVSGGGSSGDSYAAFQRNIGAKKLEFFSKPLLTKIEVVR